MKKDIAKDNLDQAVASWINYLNQVRLNELVESLNKQNINFDNAMRSLDGALDTIKNTIIDRNRGGLKGMHGFIAEVAECGIEKARQQLEGKEIIYNWINDNGPDDLVRDGLYIQQKFVNAGGHFSLNAIKEHLEKYPDYITSGKVYQIPKDHYDKIKYLFEMPEEVANKLSKSNSEFSLRKWKEIQEFFSNGDVPFDKIEPSAILYSDAQVGNISDTIKKEKKRIAEKNQKLRKEIYHRNKPTVIEGVKVAVSIGTIESVAEICSKVIQKRKDGKHITEFDVEDWKSISIDSGKSFIKGNVRGISIYMLTNYTATPAAVANSLVTASFGIAEQTFLFRQGKLTESEYVENSELMCLDVAISALSSIIGQVIIPIPCLGAMIGNTVGNLLYQIGKTQFNDYERRLLCSYAKEIEQLDITLEKQYKEVIYKMNERLNVYLTLVSDAFVPDIKEAFNSSIKLARYCGVPSEEILDTYEKVRSYFEE